MSMKKRISWLKDVNPRTSSLGRIDIRPRHPRLMNMEGWYNIIPAIRDVIPPNLFSVLDEYEKTSKRTKFTKWALRSSLITQEQASEIGNYLEPFRFKFSCRHNDLLRLSDTIHYRSCFDKWRGSQQLRYLADPDIAIVFIPDKAGKYIWRTLVRLVLNPEAKGYALFVYRIYGNGPTNSVFSELDKILPIYISNIVSRDSDFNYILGTEDLITLVSPTVHNNPIHRSIIWSDLKCVLNEENRFVVSGQRFRRRR